MNPVQVFSKARHLRTIYFIDSSLPYEQLLTLVLDNLTRWGGRYNPIIPVENGRISAEYLHLIKYYDPDFVLHSGSVDPEPIKQLRCFSPKEYINLDSATPSSIQGLSSIYLTTTVSLDRPILVGQSLFKVKSPLLDYYRINFGIRANPFVGEREVTKGREQIGISPDLFDKIHEIIHTRRPLDRVLLASGDIDTPVLRSPGEAAYDSFEIVVAKDTANTADLLYCWNRFLYQCTRIFFITLEQLALLKTDPFFSAILYDLTPNQNVHVVSLSLSEEEIANVIENDLKPMLSIRLFRHKKIDKFPFDIQDGGGHFHSINPIQPSLQTLNGTETLLMMPPLPFQSSFFFHPQEWAIDLEIRQLRPDKNVEALFPITTDIGYFLKGAVGRINKSQKISYFMGRSYPKQQAIDFSLPSFDQLLKRLIPNPVFDGVPVKSPYQHLEKHDSSNRLLSFIQLFRNDFHLIDEYFSDKFWADLFIELSTSEKAAGDAISLGSLVTRAANLMDTAGHPLGPVDETWRNEENLSAGIHDMLKELTALSVLMVGHTIKCPRCSTKAWYPLDLVGAKIRCSGCLVDFPFPIEPAFTYRLNGLIQKNLFQSKAQPDGNFTVIQTLTQLSISAPEVFDFSPQLNLYKSFRDPKPETDLDVIALKQGKLIIGEAKYDSVEFSAAGHKQLNGLVEISKAIRPDQVIIACTKDEYDRLENARKFLEHHFKHMPYRPAVIAFQVASPTYFNFAGNTYFRW